MPTSPPNAQNIQYKPTGRDFKPCSLCPFLWGGNCRNLPEIRFLRGRAVIFYHQRHPALFPFQAAVPAAVLAPRSSFPCIGKTFFTGGREELRLVTC